MDGRRFTSLFIFLPAFQAASIARMPAVDVAGCVNFIFNLTLAVFYLYVNVVNAIVGGHEGKLMIGLVTCCGLIDNAS